MHGIWRGGPSLRALEVRRRPAQGRRTSMAVLLSIGGAALALAGGSVLVPPKHVAADTPTPVAAEGDSYAVGGYVDLLSGSKIALGPVAPSVATAPRPLNPDGANVATLSCSSNCATNLINSVTVTADTSKAFVPTAAQASVAHTDCNPAATILPTGFETGALTGGNACSNIAHVEIGGSTGVVADGISVQSLTQTCTGTPLGKTSLLDLFVGGSEIGPLQASQIAPNTVIQIPSVATVILNEQIAENKSAPGPDGVAQSGHGMTVNAIHVIVPTTALLAGFASADIIIGHAHSDAICATPVTPLCTATSSDAICHGTVITKLPEGLSVSGGHFIASPGDTFSYSISIANVANCPVRQVTDILPVGFNFVSATGSLGAPETPIGTAQNGGQMLSWFNPTGWNTPNPLVEHITVKIAADEPPGAYVNQVQVLDDCDQNSASSPPVFVQGGTVQPTPTPSNSGTPTPTPSGSATPTPSGSATPTPSASASATPTPSASASATASPSATSSVQSLIKPPSTGAAPLRPDLGVGIGLVAAGVAAMAAGIGTAWRRRRARRS